MWRLTAVALATVSACALLAPAGLTAPAPVPVRLDPDSLGRLFFAPRFARAELVLVGAGRVARSVRIDRGRVVAVTAGSLTLREADGTLVAVPVSAAASVRVNGRQRTLLDVRRGLVAMTVREGDGPASAVVASGRATAAAAPPVAASAVRVDPRSLGRLFFTWRFARAELVLVDGQRTARGVRLDRGRVTAFSGGSLTLREPDGALVTVPVSPTAAVRINGRARFVGDLRRGMVALTVRDGGAATAVEAQRR